MGNREPVQSRGVSRVRGLFTWRRAVVAACLLVVVGIGLLLWPGRSLEERLRAIDAASQWSLLLLLALRRHKNEASTWPGNLREIESGVSPEALIDPLTKKPFMYRSTGDSLILYDVGPNGIDEGGESGDDYRFWPSSQR
jgi:hypothetical protein